MSGGPVSVVPVSQPPAVAAAAARARPPLRAGTDVAQLLRGAVARVNNEWLPRALWSISRTGASGAVGLALLVASAAFYVSTHRPIVAEVDSLRADLARAHSHAASSRVDAASARSEVIGNLPKRIDMPVILGVMLQQADSARLSIDTGKYEATATKNGGVVRYKVSFPVTGPYPQIRQFIDSTLRAIPAVAINELAIERKSIAEGTVEAQIRLTVFTRDVP